MRKRLFQNLFLKNADNDNVYLGIAFTPREAGDHEVTVLKDGKPIAGSPFTIHVKDSEIGNASRVRAYGKGLVEGTTNEINEFTVDSKNAGQLFVLPNLLTTNLSTIAQFCMATGNI